jgi:mevalonate kinase
MTVAYAPGKVILFGEHAVVYGRPAVAVPVTQVKARVIVEDAPKGCGITIVASDLGKTYRLKDAPLQDPLSFTILNTLELLSPGPDLDLKVTINSTIPIARGLGSGAAVSTAIVKALAEHFGKNLSKSAISDLVYETEKIHHGTPSGIDNTVIAYEAPLYFVKGKKMEIFSVKRPFILLIVDTGVKSHTKIIVEDVRRAWERERERYERLFDEMGAVAEAGRRAIEDGDIEEIGRLMYENQRLLKLIDVSSPELDALVNAARRGGALGAKLSGAGRGGNAIALVMKETYTRVSKMMKGAGARGVIITEVR